MNTTNRVIKNTGFLYAKMGITMFISLYTTRLVLNALGVSDFGIFNVIGGAIGMLSFLHTAMASATQRFMSYSEGEGDKTKQRSIFNISIILHFFIAIALGIVLLICGYFFFHGMLKIPPERIHAAHMIYYFMIVSAMFTVMTAPYEAVLNAHENMLYFSIVGVIESVLKLMVAWGVVYTMMDKLVLYGVLMAAVSFIVMLIMRIYTHRHYSECTFKPKKYWNRALMKEMASFAGWNFLGNSSGIINGYGSNIVLNNFFGTALNAANGICGQINGQLMAFSSNMIKAVNPIIVKTEGSGNRHQMFKASFAACKLSVLIYSFFAIPFIVESSFILKLWLKNVPPYTELFLQLMAIQVLVEQVSSPLGTAIAAIGKIKQYNIINSLILYLEIILLYYSYKIGFPPQTLRIIAIIGAVLLTIYKAIYCYYYCQMPLKQYINNVLLKCIIVITLTFSLLLGIQQLLATSFIRLGLECFISLFTFTILFYYIALLPEEKLQVQNLIQNKIRSFNKCKK